MQIALLESLASFIHELATKKILTTPSKFVESAEANQSGFERNGLDLTRIRDRPQVVDGFLEHADNVAMIGPVLNPSSTRQLVVPAATCLSIFAEAFPSW